MFERGSFNPFKLPSTLFNLIKPPSTYLNLNKLKISMILTKKLIYLVSHRCINFKIIIMYTFSFERLEVWNKSRLLTKKVYKITQAFSESEKFVMVSQLRRAVISICSNIAEGSSRKSKRDQAHFYNIAFSSLMETLNQLIISNDLEYLDAGTLAELRKDIHVISLMLNNLCNSVGR